MATSLPVLEEVVAGLSITLSERAATVSGIAWGGISARHSQGGLLVMKLNAQTSQIAGLLKFSIQRFPRSAMVAHHVSRVNSELLHLPVGEDQRLQDLRAFSPAVHRGAAALAGGRLRALSRIGDSLSLISLLSVILFVSGETWKLLKRGTSQSLIASTG